MERLSKGVHTATMMLLSLLAVQSIMRATGMMTTTLAFGLSNTHTTRTQSRAPFARAPLVVSPSRLSQTDATAREHGDMDSGIGDTCTSSSTASSGGWSVTDNWRMLSDATEDQDNEQNFVLHGSSRTAASPFASSSSSDYEEEKWDHTTLAALRMQNYGMNPEPVGEVSPEDEWLQTTIEQYVRRQEDDDDEETHGNNDVVGGISRSSNNNGNGHLHSKGFEDDMGREIAMLVRCNEHPAQMLLEQGRFVPELTEAQRNDVQQLITWRASSSASSNSTSSSRANDSSDVADKAEFFSWHATPFLHEAVKVVFQSHAVPVNAKTSTVVGETANNAKVDKVLNAPALAAWMSQCVNESVGTHDKRVSQTLAKFGRLGLMTETDLLQYYVSAICGSDNSSHNGKKPATGPWSTVKQLEQHRRPEIEAVWRDLRLHGVVSPAEFQRTMQLAELEAAMVVGDITGEVDDFYKSYNILDECEILEDHLTSTSSPSEQVSMTTDRQGKSSHERLELYKNVPVWMSDGDFVFIDEQSCIGCMQCTTAAPASFQMLEHNGRARTFVQRKSPDVKTAVASCPADCMHYVSYEELLELERARDDGVSSGVIANDHRHFGHSETRGYVAPTPLHVSRREMYTNHRDSYYHFLRNKCFKSTQCPQRGCYDCPRYKDEPGSNPYFKERLAKATSIRTEYFIKTGIADPYRKTAEL